MGGWDIRNGYVHTYVDPRTGTEYEVPHDVSYNYYWIDSSGNVVGSNSSTPSGFGYTRLNTAP